MSKDLCFKINDKLLTCFLLYQPLRVRAMIGLSALFPVYKLPASTCQTVPGLKDKINELLQLRSEIVGKLGVSFHCEISKYDPSTCLLA